MWSFLQDAINFIHGDQEYLGEGGDGGQGKDGKRQAFWNHINGVITAKYACQSNGILVD